MNNFFEHELRKLFGDGEIIQSPRFTGRACLGTLGKDLRVRAQFVTTGIADHYDALRINVLNPIDGPVDTITFRFREMERRAADVIEAITNVGMKYGEDEEVVNVCQAVQEMRMESEKKGELKGELKKAKEDAQNFYKLGVDIEKVALGVGYAVETVKEWVGLTNK